jgi:hypothetical protein
MHTAATTRALIGFVVLALLYAGLVPPFESPDENSHYEYARLLGELGRPPSPAERSTALRDVVERYMLERGYGLIQPQPDGRGRLGFGDETQRQPPTYYALAAPLGRLAPDDLEWQLRAMRLASVALATVVVAAAAVAGRALFPADRFARLALPLAVALTPGFAFIGASVNNDNLANAGAAVAFAGLAVALGRGVSPAALAMVGLGLVVGIAGKRTALPLLPAALLGLYWIVVARVGWPRLFRAALAAAPVVAVVALAPLAFEESGRATGWQVEHAAEASRAADGLFGVAALRVAPGPDGRPSRLQQHLGAADVARAAESGLTATAWVRASDEVAPGQPGPKVRLQLVQGGAGPSDERTADGVWRPLRVAATPHREGTVSLLLAVEPGAGAALVDGVVVALGQRDGLPDLGDASGRTGRWQETAYANLARNGSGEEAERALAGWLARLAEPLGASSALLVAMTDLSHLVAMPPAVLEHRLWFAFYSYVGRFGWLVLPMPDLAYGSVQLAVGLAGVGLTLRLVGALRGDGRAGAAIGLSALVASTVLAAGILPFLTGALGDEWPQGRYLYPAIVPLSALLVYGLGRLVPPRLAGPAVALFAAGGIALNGVALLGTILPRYAGAS